MHRDLTPTDLALIQELERDARRSNCDLAAKLGVSERTVRRRLQRLIKEHMVSIQAIAGPLPLDSKMMAVLGINVDRGQVDMVLDKLGSFPAVMGVTVVTGRYNILAWVICHRLEELWRVVTEELASIESVAGIEILPVLRTMKRSYAVLADNHPLPEPEPRAYRWNGDELDMVLIRELEVDGTQGIAALARKLGMSPPTVRKRIHRLLKEQIITVVAVANPYLLGYHTSAAILLKARPARIKAVADQLVSIPKVQILSATAGPYDLIAWVVFKDTHALSEFVRNELDSIVGIMTYEILVNLKYGKLSTDLTSQMIVLGEKQDREDVARF